MRSPVPYRFNTRFYARQLALDFVSVAQSLARRVERASVAMQALGPSAVEGAARLSALVEGSRRCQ